MGDRVSGWTESWNGDKMILTILGLFFIFFFHEIGHYLAAKAIKVKVDEFSIGIGGKNLYCKEISGTVYSLKLIFLGGYVKLEDSFRDRSPLTRIFVGLAGPAASVLFAFLVFTFVSFVGLPELTSKIGSVFPGYPAAQAGMLPGDQVVAIEGHPVSRWMEMISIINAGKDRKLRVTVRRERSNFDVFVRPVLKEGRGAIGVKASGESVATRYGLSSVMQGARLVGENLKSDFDILKHVVVFKKAGGVAGPVEILQIGAIQAGFGIVTFLNLLALLSLSFFVINLFPVPPLDGGAIAIALFESAIGRQINRQVEIMVTKVVLSIFVGLLVFNVLSALAKKLI